MRCFASPREDAASPSAGIPASGIPASGIPVFGTPASPDGLRMDCRAIRMSVVCGLLPHRLFALLT